MELKQLEAFICVMENRSFSAAAEKLYLSQPTVSAHIATLEKELGTKLIMRTTKELYPSPAGYLFYDYAKKMQTLQKEAKEKITEISGGKKGAVTVAASTIPMQSIVPGVVKAFNERYGDISLDIQTTDSQDVVEMVSRHIAEIGFCGTEIKNSRCSFAEIGEDSIAIAAPDLPRFRSYMKTGFPPRSIERELIISRERGSGTRRETEQFLKEMGVNCQNLHIAGEYHSNDEILEKVIAGEGITLLSRKFFESRKGGKFLCLDFAGAKLKRKLYIVRHKKIELSPAAAAFYDFALKEGRG